MSRLFDTHVHFDVDAITEHSAMIERAREVGVQAMIGVGGSPGMNSAALTVARAFPETVFPAIGYDRGQASSMASDIAKVEEAIEGLKSQISSASESGVKIVALGEIGLDLFYEPEQERAQVELFKAQLGLARELRLPVIVHSREADGATLEELARHASEWDGPGDCIGVLHCFTGKADFAERLVELGFHVSFSGILTFRNADSLRAVAAEIPEDRLLIETDTPYLAPVPQRGRKNEPAFLPHVAQRLAGVRGCSVDEVAQITTRNAKRLFL